MCFSDKQDKSLLMVGSKSQVEIDRSQEEPLPPPEWALTLFVMVIVAIVYIAAVAFSEDIEDNGYNGDKNGTVDPALFC